MKALHIYVVLFVVWLIFLVFPQVAYPFATMAYWIFVGNIGFSAVRYRRQGWVSGLTLSLLLATLPLWVLALYRFYESLIEK